MENEIPEVGYRPKRNRTLWIIGIVVAVHVVLIGSAFIIQQIHRTDPAADTASVNATDAETLGVPAPLPEPGVAPAPRATAAAPAIPAPAPAEKPSLAAAKAPVRVAAPASPAPSPAPAVSKTASQVYVVKKGDSWSKLAVKFKTSPSQLARDNKLDAKKMLKAGQKLVVRQAVETPVKVAASAPAPKPAPVKAAKTPALAAAPGLPKPAETETAGTFVAYEVKKGDSLTVIAARHAMRTSDLRALNGLKDDKIQVGQKLKVQEPGPKPATSNLLADVQPRETAPKIHVVTSGETVSVIARRYGVPAGEVLKANNIADPTKMNVGRRLKIPAHQPSTTATPSAVQPPAETAATLEPAQGAELAQL